VESPTRQWLFCATGRDVWPCRNASRSMNSARVRLSSSPSGISETLDGLIERMSLRGMRTSAFGPVTSVTAPGVSCPRTPEYVSVFVSALKISKPGTKLALGKTIASRMS